MLCSGSMQHPKDDIMPLESSNPLKLYQSDIEHATSRYHCETKNLLLLISDHKIELRLIFFFLKGQKEKKRSRRRGGGGPT